jgi:hypothetical protein
MKIIKKTSKAIFRDVWTSIIGFCFGLSVFRVICKACNGEKESR